MMTGEYTELLSIPASVTLLREGARCSVRGALTQVDLGELPPALADALASLFQRATTEGDLLSRVEEADGLLATARFSLLLESLAAQGLIGRALALGGEPLASFWPMTAPAPSPAPIEESNR